MFEASDARARRRLVLIVITLATIPCYCIGWIAIMIAPDSTSLTQTPTETTTAGPTMTGTLQFPTLSLTPLIVTGTITNTPTFTPTPTFTTTPTASLTPFQPATSTYTLTFTPSNTPTLTPSSTSTWTPSPTNTFTPTLTLTPIPLTPSNTLTPSITPFP